VFLEIMELANPLLAQLSSSKRNPIDRINDKLKIIFFILILAVFILSPAVFVDKSVSLLYYGFSGLPARTLIIYKYAHKKSVALFRFHRMS